MLRVVTLNIWNLMGPWRERRLDIVAWIDELAPDVVCLQEVMTSADGRDQAAWIGEHCQGTWHHFTAGADVGNGIRVGNAVLSRQPIDTTNSIDLPGADARDDLQRVVAHARTGGVDVYATHLAWRFEEGVRREAQVVVLDEFVRTTADPQSPMPPVIGGDFNAEPDSAEIRFMCGLQSLEGRSTYYQDAWRIADSGRDGDPGYTWDNANPFAALDHEPDRRIDYVFVGWRKDTGAGKVVHCEVVANRPLTGTFPADHFGLLADITT